MIKHIENRHFWQESWEDTGALIHLKIHKVNNYVAIGFFKKKLLIPHVKASTIFCFYLHKFIKQRQFPIVRIILLRF